MRAQFIAVVFAAMLPASVAMGEPMGFVDTNGGQIISVDSFNSAGQTNVVALVGNTAQVTLPGLGNGLNSNVQVSAANTNGHGHYCTAINWFSTNGIDVTVNVACFSPAGSPILADFAMLYQVRTARPVGADIAFVWANQPGAASYTPDSQYSFNSIGGANTVTRQSPGNYTVILGDFQANDTNAQVTAYGNTAARCQIAGWMGVFADGAHVNVLCVNAANAPTDEFFSLTYTLGGVEGSGNAVGAFGWGNRLKAKSYVLNKRFQFSNISQAQLLTGVRFGGPLQGQYEMVVPNPGSLTFSSFLGMVTSYGSNGEYCDTDGIFLNSSEIDLGVVCYDSNGTQINTLYSATMMAIP